MNKGLDLLSSITVWSKYAKYVPQLQRRENWSEITYRYLSMMETKYPVLKDDIYKYGQLILDKKILPSMRMLQFAGKAIEINHARGYNCSYLPIDDYRAFGEVMFLLLGGTGVGYSVQKNHVDKLPEIRKSKSKRKYVVSDDIQGWANSIKILMKSYYGMCSKPVFDYSDIRPKGARLVTAGGKAPGPDPLKLCHFQIESILDRKNDGEKLTPLECHDILCHIANSVLAGGIRRSAMIAGFDIDDQEMLTCKFGDWWELNEQRGRANNSAVLKRSKLRKDDFEVLWKKIETSGSGEPGFYLSNNTDWFTNPCCISGDTWVTTEEGPRRVNEIVGQSTKLLMDGHFYSTTDEGFWPTGVKEVYELKLRNGLKIKATSDHRFLTSNNEWRELGDLKVGESLFISHNEKNQWIGLGGDEKEGWLVGNLIGDGTFYSESIAKFSHWGENKMDMSRKTKSFLSSTVRESVKKRSYINEHSINSTHDTHDNISVHSLRFGEIAKKWGVIKGNKHFNDTIEKGSSEFYKGVIGGFFDAAGSVWGNNKTGLNVSLSQSHLESLEIIQRMLLRLGIESNIYNIHNGKDVLMPDGKGGSKFYKCKASYELRVSGRYMVGRFFSTIFIQDETKIKKYNSREQAYTKNPYKRENMFSSEVESITLKGVEQVFDCTVPEVSCFEANGIITHNCEIALRPFQMCNLCEINFSSVENQQDFEQRVEAASFFGTLQAGFTDFYYLRDVWRKTCEKDALLGIGITGLASNKINEIDFEQAIKQVAIPTNKKIASIIGINPSARISCVKPSGTTSCVLGTSSGIHDWHSKYYIRTIRFGKDEAVSNYLKKINPSMVEDDILRPHDTVCIRIPIKAPEGAIVREDVSEIDLLERVKLVSEKWVKPGHIKGDNTHNVSATISIKEDKWDEVGEWMWKNKKYYNGLSVLPYWGGTYQQAPFEEVTEEKYNELISNLKDIDLDYVIELEDITDLKSEAACAGGACEIV